MGPQLQLPSPRDRHGRRPWLWARSAGNVRWTRSWKGLHPARMRPRSRCLLRTCVCVYWVMNARWKNANGRMDEGRGEDGMDGMDGIGLDACGLHREWLIGAAQAGQEPGNPTAAGFRSVQYRQSYSYVFFHKIAAPQSSLSASAPSLGTVSKVDRVNTLGGTLVSAE